jgi:hypothetical protein
MKLKYVLIISSCLGVVLMFNSCGKSFLDQTPRGVLDEPTLATEKGVNKLLLAAYAMLDGHDGGLGLGGEWGSGGSNFLYGDIGGGIANKGSSFDDQGPNMSPVQRHDIQPGNGAINDRWKAIYEGVKRTNTVMQVLAKATVTDDVRKKLAGQARFLRAFYHFEARKIFEKVPYLDEVIDAQLAAGEIKSVANDADIYPKIVEDAKYAWDNLPQTQSAVGLVNKWAAGALYGKILMFTKDFATAKTVLTDVVNNGKNSLGVKYDLNANYYDNFNVDFDNSKESVFAFQASSKDNAGARNANWGDLLNTPASTGGGGAGFFTPTYFFANQFKTGADGLPLANPLNNEVFDVFGQAALTRYTGNVDTRLDWTIGRDGVPFHDWGTYLTSWPRATDAGPYAGKKIMIRQSQVDASHDASIWFIGGGTALNMNLIRFADVILLLAEAEIEAGTLANATALVNRVRNRAKTSSKVVFADSCGKILIEPYPATFADQATARKAVRLERVLELGMEGHRFFDLVRWGTASQEITSYYQYETGANFTYQKILRNPVPTYTSPAKDYYPIPQQQVDLSGGFIKQR